MHTRLLHQRKAEGKPVGWSYHTDAHRIKAFGQIRGDVGEAPWFDDAAPRTLTHVPDRSTVVALAG